MWSRRSPPITRRLSGASSSAPHPWLFILIVVWAVLGSAQSAAGKEVRHLLDEDSAWEHSAWRNHGTVSADHAEHRGDGSSIRIDATRTNDIRYRAPAQVRAGYYYRFSAWIRTADVAGEVGANLAVEGTFNRSSVDLRGDNDWTRV